MDKRYYEEKNYAQSAYAARIERENMECCHTLTEEQHLAIHYLRGIRHHMHVDGAKDAWGGNDWMYKAVGGIMEGMGNINEKLQDAELPAIELLTFDDCANKEALSEIPECYIEDGESYDDAYFRLYSEICDIVNENDRRIRRYLKKIDEEHGTTYCPTGKHALNYCDI